MTIDSKETKLRTCLRIPQKGYVPATKYVNVNWKTVSFVALRRGLFSPWETVRFSIPEKVGALPVKGGEEEKRTNEIKIAAPLLNEIDIKGRTITADAPLTQRTFADYLVNERHAHYHLTVKGDQSTVLEDVRLYLRIVKNRILLSHLPYSTVVSRLAK